MPPSDAVAKLLETFQEICKRLEFGQFVLLNTNAGFAFYWGNHPVHGSTFVPILPGDGSEYGSLIPAELLNLNEAQLDRALFVRGLGFALDDPARYLTLSLSRVKEYFKFWPSAESSALSNYARSLSFGLGFPLLLAGLALAFGVLPGSKDVASHGDLSAIRLVSLLGALYTLVHVLTWALVRYRLPVDAITLPFMALSILHATDILIPRRRPTWLQPWETRFSTHSIESGAPNHES